MYARLLMLTLIYQSAARQAGFNRRTTLSISEAEWMELLDDPQFAKSHDGKDHTVINEVVVRKAVQL